MEPVHETALGLQLFDADVVGVRDQRTCQISEGVADEIGLGSRSVCGRRYAGRFFSVALCFCHMPVRLSSAVALALG